MLGNHDYQSDRQEEIRHLLEGAGVQVLEGESTVVEIDGRRVGIAGCKGFGGGFLGACASDFGEPEMKAFVGHTKAIAEQLHLALARLDSDVRIALLHFSPVEDTLVGERLEIYPFLGSYLLAEAIDRVGADLVLHGHAHGGSEKGVTAGGVPVRTWPSPSSGTPTTCTASEVARSRPVSRSPSAARRARRVRRVGRVWPRQSLSAA